MFKRTTTSVCVAAAAAFCFTAATAMAEDPTQPAGKATITKDEAKSLKAESEAIYKARKNVAEANRDLSKGDCQAALEGSAKRACEKTARANAKSDKAAAKTVHEIEEQKIKDATAK